MQFFSAVIAIKGREYTIRWLIGGVMVRASRRACDQQVASSTPGFTPPGDHLCVCTSFTEDIIFFSQSTSVYSALWAVSSALISYINSRCTYLMCTTELILEWMIVCVRVNHFGM